MFTTIVKSLALLLALSNTVVSDSTTLSSIVVYPIDYDTYGNSIDLQQLYYYESGDVFFYDTDGTSSGNETKTVKNATILDNGQLDIGTKNDDWFLTIDDVSGVVSVTDDDTKTDGIFSIDSGNIHYQYHGVFVACQQDSDSHSYTLTWRGASSPAICENDWLLVYLQTYSSSGVVSQYHPDGYVSSIASTATDNTATSTATAPVSSASSSNGANLPYAAGTGVAVYSGLSVLFISLISWIC